jgi:hypothetical protein
MSARLFACDEESRRQESSALPAMSQFADSPLPRMSAMTVQKRFNDTEAEALPVEMLELGRLIDSMIQSNVADDSLTLFRKRCPNFDLMSNI